MASDRAILYHQYVKYAAMNTPGAVLGILLNGLVESLSDARFHGTLRILAR